jgi:hypothetical protein
MAKKMLIGAFLVLLAFGLPGLSWASTVSGTLMKIEGSTYVIKDDNRGDEHRVQIDISTTIQGNPKEGARVEVEVDDQSGHAKSIKVKA